MTKVTENRSPTPSVILAQMEQIADKLSNSIDKVRNAELFIGGRTSELASSAGLPKATEFRSYFLADLQDGLDELNNQLTILYHELLSLEQILGYNEKAEYPGELNLDISTEDLT